MRGGLRQSDRGRRQPRQQQLVERAVLEIGTEQAIQRQQRRQHRAYPDDARRDAAKGLRGRPDGKREQSRDDQEEQQCCQRIRAVAEREA
jgi:hypothetical protein